MDRLDDVKEALPNFETGIVSKQFVNFHHRRYKGITLRYQNGTLLNHNSRAFKSRPVKTIESMRNLSQRVELHVRNLDSLVRKHANILNLVNEVAKWAERPGRQDVAKAIARLKPTHTTTEPLYRGMILKHPKTVNLEYSSWTTELKQARLFSKGMACAALPEKGDLGIVFKAPKNLRQLICIDKLMTDRGLVLLAESGYFDTLEPGTLQFSETIACPTKLNFEDILEVRKLGKTGWYKTKLEVWHEL